MDEIAFLLVNSLAGRSELADGMVKQIAGNPLFKGIFVMMLVWGLWFSQSGNSYGRAKTLALLTIAVLAAGVGRLSAALFPYKHRPIHTEGLELNTVLSQTILEGWSSFPSDHAVLFFCIAVSAFFISATMGVILLTHAVFVISLPRIYLGLHWPADILAGALIGALIATVLTIPIAKFYYRHGIIRIFEAKPYWAYPGLFLVSVEIAVLFNHVRSALGSLASALASF